MFDKIREIFQSKINIHFFLHKQHKYDNIRSVLKVMTISFAYLILCYEIDSVHISRGSDKLSLE